MRTLFKIGIIGLTITFASCSTTSLADKPDVQAPLKLSEASETMTHVCGSYGCDDQLRKRCNGADFEILSQDTLNKYQSRKNNVTGGFDNSRTESVTLIFKCVNESESTSVKSE